jgi:hypothetical protein
MLTVKKVLSLKIEIRYVNIHMAKNVHAEVVDECAPRKVGRVVDLIASKVDFPERVRA